MKKAIKLQAKRTVFTITIAILVAAVLLGVILSPLNNNYNNSGFASGYTFADVTESVDESHGSQYLKTIDDDSHAFLKADDTVTAIVVLDGGGLMNSVADGGSKEISNYIKSAAGATKKNSLLGYQNTFRKRLEKSYDLSFKASYTNIMNGFSVSMKYGDVAALRKEQGIKNVIVSETYLLPETTTVIENEVNVTDNGIYDSTGIDYDGTGTIIAILDSGLDYNHSAFQQELNNPDNVAMTLADVENAFDKIKASENAANVVPSDLYISNRVPFAYDYADSDVDVYPLEMHGTHVAGIVAGLDEDWETGDGIRGVAPQAQLAIMKVFSDARSSTTTDIIFLALEDCVVLGVDVINMSLGTSCGFAEEEDDEGTAELYQELYDAGIAIIVAAGNEGSSAKGTDFGDTGHKSNPDTGTIGSPASYNMSLAVASISGVKSEYLEANGSTPVYITAAIDAELENLPFSSKLLGDKEEQTFEYVTVPGVGNDGNYNSLDVKGKIALVQRGLTSFTEKAEIAYSKGAAALIVYNNVAGSAISMSMGDFDDIPVCSITLDVGQVLASVPKGTIRVSKSLLAGPFMSAFSSWGVLPNLELKPDVTAHGGSIRSAAPGQTYDRISGTSMAAPNMAGAVMLVIQYIHEHENLFGAIAPKDITALAYQLVMSTATVAVNEENNPYSPRRQGAGLASIDRATTTKAYAFVKDADGNQMPMTKISAGDDVQRTGVYELSFSVRNVSNDSVTYNVDPDVFTETVASDNLTVAEKPHMFSERKVEISNSINATVSGTDITIKGGETADFTVKITLSKNEKDYIDENFENGMYVEGYLTLNSKNEDKIGLSIPFLAFYGDWTEAPIFDVDGYELAESKADPTLLDDEKLKSASYATMPIGLFSSGSSEYTYFLGNFGYELKDKDNIPTPKKEYISMTANPQGMYGLYALGAGMIRSAKRVDYKIYNSLTGDILKEKSLENVAKSNYRSTAGARIPAYLDMNINASLYAQSAYAGYYEMPGNTKYTADFKAYIDYNAHESNNKKDEYSFEFMIDSERPEILQDDILLRVDDSGSVKKYYLDIYIYDNHYLQALIATTYSSKTSAGKYLDEKAITKDNVEPIVGSENSVNKVTLNITDHWNDIVKNNYKIYLEAVDYARNRSSYDITVPSNTEGISFSQEEVTIAKGESYKLNDLLSVEPVGSWAGVEWSSTDNSVAEVREGLVVGRGYGTATITATSVTGLKAAITVKVEGDSSGTTNLKSLILDNTTLSLYQGDTGVLSLSLDPWNVSNLDTILSKLEWSSDLSDYVSITKDKNDPTKATYKVLKHTNSVVTITVGQKGSFISATCKISLKSNFIVTGTQLTGFKGDGPLDGVVEIPDDQSIYSIGSVAFEGNNTIKKLIIPETIKSIEAAAFMNMTALEEVVWPSKIKIIPEYCFMGCKKLKTVSGIGSGEWGDGWIRSIGYASFAECKKLELDLSKVIYMGDYAFAESGIVSIDISSAAHLGIGAFISNYSLTTIKSSPNTNWGNGSFGDCTALEEVEIHSKSLGNKAASAFGTFQECTSLKKVTFTNDIDYVGAMSFFSCDKLETVIFKKSVGHIDQFAFYKAPLLKTVRFATDINDGTQYITDIDDCAFSYCPSLETLDFGGAKIGRIGSYAFARTVALKNLTISSVDTIESFAFAFVEIYINGELAEGETLTWDPDEKSGLLTVQIDAIKTIGNSAFLDNKALNSLTLGNNVEIDSLKGAFVGCDALDSNITIAGDNGYIKLDAVNYLILSADGTTVVGAIDGGPKTIDLTGIKKISAGAFLGSKITTIINAESVTEIGDRAFMNSEITSYNFGAALTKIGEYAFYEATKLSGVDLSGTALVSIGNGAFASSGTARGTVTYGTVVPATIKSIGEYAFAGIGAITSLRINGNPTYGEFTFANSTKLKEITFETQIVDYADYMFAGTAIESFNISNKVKTLGKGMFYSCEKLRTITFDANSQIKVIPTDFVGGPTSSFTSQLTSVSLPDSIETIGASAFYQCRKLNELNLKNVKTIDSYAFLMSGLKKLNAPEATSVGAFIFTGTDAIGTSYTSSVTEINLPKAEIIYDNSFANLPHLTTVNIQSATELGAYAFINCKNLSKVTATNLEIIYAGAFRGTGLTSAVRFPSLRVMQDDVFYETKITELILPASLETVTNKTFNSMGSLKAITVEEGGENYFSEDGVIYRYAISGGYQLVSYPAGKRDASYDVKANTVRISPNAFNGNYYLAEVTLPRTLKSVGFAAFAGCNVLNTINFLSAETPIIEINPVMSYSSTTGLYTTVLDAYPLNGTVKITVPANAADGYKSDKYKTFFDGRITYRSDIAIEAKTTEAQGYINALESLLAAGITLDDQAAINAARNSYNALEAPQKALIQNYVWLTFAEAKIVTIMAKADAEKVVAMINALPEKIKGEDRAAVEAARKAYNELSDEAKIYVTNYEKLLSSEKVGCGSYAGSIGGIAGIIALLMACGVILFVKKKKGSVKAE